MYWSAEEFVLVITGLLFLVVVASSFLPRVELTPVSRAAFAIGALAFTGAAALLARIEDVLYPPLLWAAPVVPVIVLVVIARDAARASAASPASAPIVRRASTQVSGEIETAAGRALRARAASPQATAHELAQIAWRHEHLRPLVAANPATPVAVLEWLSSHGDDEINAAIAARSGRLPGAAGPAASAA